MAARASLDSKLAALRDLRGQVLAPEQVAEIRKALGDRSSLVAAAAAALAGDHALVELAADLVAAFRRFLIDPLNHDKLCRAKLAAIQTLDRLKHSDPRVFHEAATYVQFEPVWNGKVDTATTLRATALVALARIEGTSCLPILVDALTDPMKEVRAAAAVALGAVGSEGAGLVLRLKVRLGDPDTDVFSECLAGLLAVDPVGCLPLVAGFLEPRESMACEAAALALGRSRLVEALEPLRTAFERCIPSAMRSRLLLAIAILRRPAASDYLLTLLTDENEAIAESALSALKVYAADSRIRERIEDLVRQRNSPALRAGFEREFRRGEP